MTNLFVGRKEQLKELYNVLHPGDDYITSATEFSKAKAVLCGVGGVGKTQLALKFIKEYYHNYDSIIWINAESYESTLIAFTNLAEILKVVDISKNIKIIVAEIYRKLTQNGAENLIIFDNVDDYVPSEFWFSAFDKFSVLVTSRYQMWTYLKVIKVGLFTDDEAVDFIKKSLFNENYDTLQEVTDLAKILENYPLALQQAVAYIRQNHREERFTINDYLKKYDSRRRELLNYKFRNENNEPNLATTFCTWSITIEKLQSLNYNEKIGLAIQQNLGTKEPLQIRILNFISYMDSEKIDTNLFVAIADNDKKHLHWAVFQLNDYSMAQAVKDKIEKDDKKMEHVHMSVHKLVQQVTRLRLEEMNVEEPVFCIVYQILNNNLSRQKNTMVDIENDNKLLPHFVALKLEIEHFGKNKQIEMRIQQDYIYSILLHLHNLYSSISNPTLDKSCLLQRLLIQQRLFGFGNVETADTVSKLGYAIGELGHAKTQKILSQKALKIFEICCGPNSFEVAATLNELANAYNKLGDYKTQKKLRIKALKIVENYYPDHKELPTFLSGLAMAYGNLGEPNMEKQLLERSLVIQESQYDSKHINIATTLTNLANAYDRLGKPHDQTNLLDRALKINEGYYGPEHFRVAEILCALSKAYLNLGQFEKQKLALERALKIQEKHFSPEHFMVAQTLACLAIAHGKLGDLENQKQLLERALKIQENYYGLNHFELAATLINLSIAYNSLGEYIMQRNLLERALKIQKTYYGYDHCDIAVTLNNLGVAYSGLGDIEKQKQALERALKIQEHHYGAEHYAISSTLINLGIVYYYLGNPSEQKRLLERALEIRKNHYGPNHVEVSVVLINLALAYGNLGDFKMKQQLLLRALEIRETCFGVDHFEIAIPLVNLANTHGELGDYETLKLLLERALKIQEMHYGHDHVALSSTLTSLGIANGQLGDQKTEKELLEEALKIKESHYGCESFKLAVTLKNLANAYGKLGNLKEQKSLLERTLKIEEIHYGSTDHFNVIATLTSLAYVHNKLGDFQMQKEFLEKALKISESHYGIDSVRTIEINVLMAKSGNLSNINPEQFEKYLSIAKNQYKPDHSLIQQLEDILRHLEKFS